MTLYRSASEDLMTRAKKKGVGRQPKKEKERLKPYGPRKLPGHYSIKNKKQKDRKSVRGDLSENHQEGCSLSSKCALREREEARKELGFQAILQGKHYGNLPPKVS